MYITLKHIYTVSLCHRHFLLCLFSFDLFDTEATFFLFCFVVVGGVCVCVCVCVCKKLVEDKKKRGRKRHAVLWFCIM